MAPIARCLAGLAVAVVAAALATPHIPRNAHAHRALALDTDAHVPPAIPAASVPKRKRSLNKRCVPRPTNSTSSAAPQTSTAPVNVAPSPVLSSSSSSPPPPPSTSQGPPPTSTQPPPPPPTTSSAPPPAQTSSGSNSGEPSFMSGTQSGQGTYYETGLGACGITNNDGQRIAAVSELLFDTYPGYDGSDPNSNPVCNKQVTAFYGGKSTTVTITDRCTACAITDLDFSPTAFQDLADESLGRISITWVWS
ncbi:RlpA-like double-psi beta-barrel-protein domain-containing protein-containing protein [Phlebopus sp. FC_14]|nr:RlpA-like double-psi beta-barrel-protein domain-containing protein-containing protein [Phlebopus sp. FC_14]